MADIIQWRRGTAAQWTTANTLLANGEVGYETDTKKWKVGNGTTPWNTLPYQDVSFTPDTFEGAGTTGYVPDPITESGRFLSDDGTFQAPPVSPIGGVYLNMRFDSNTNTTVDPGSGDIRVNAAGDHLAATQMAASETTVPGNDASIVWENLEEGDFLGLWETGQDHEGIVYAITGTPVDQGTWWQIPIQAVPGQTATGIDNNQALQVFFIVNPARYIPAGGTTGQVLTKTSNDNYDTAWENAQDIALTDNIDYTVGPGGDFTTLADAIAYINTRPVGAGNATGGSGTRVPRYTLTITADQPDPWRLEAVSAQVWIVGVTPAQYTIGGIGVNNIISRCDQLTVQNLEMAGTLTVWDSLLALGTGWDGPNLMLQADDASSVGIGQPPVTSLGRLVCNDNSQVLIGNSMTVAPQNPLPDGGTTAVPGVSLVAGSTVRVIGDLTVDLTALPLSYSVSAFSNSTLTVDGNLVLVGGGDSTEVVDYYAFDLKLNSVVSVTGIYTGANYYVSLSDYLPGFSPGDTNGPIGVIQPDGSTYYSSTVQPWNYINMRVPYGAGVSNLTNDKGYLEGLGVSIAVVTDELPATPNINTLYFLTGTGGYTPPGVPGGPGTPGPVLPPNPATVVYFSGAESNFIPGQNPGADVDGWGVETRSDRPSTDSISFSTDYAFRGTHSIKAGAVRAWGADPNGKWRAEFKRPSGIYLEEGEEYWLAWCVLLPNTPSGNAQANMSRPNNSMMQTHQMDTVISQKPQIHFDGGNYRGAMLNYYDNRVLGPINTGQWDIFVAHFKVSKGSDGFLDLWLNAQPGDAPTQSWTGPNMVPAESRFNLKFGMYRGDEADSWAGMTECWQYYDEIRIAQGPNAKFEDVWPESY